MVIIWYMRLIKCLVSVCVWLTTNWPKRTCAHGLFVVPVWLTSPWERVKWLMNEQGPVNKNTRKWISQLIICVIVHLIYTKRLAEHIGLHNNDVCHINQRTYIECVVFKPSQKNTINTHVLRLRGYGHIECQLLFRSADHHSGYFFTLVFPCEWPGELILLLVRWEVIACNLKPRFGCRIARIGASKIVCVNPSLHRYSIQFVRRLGPYGFIFVGAFAYDFDDVIIWFDPLNTHTHTLSPHFN